MAASSPFSGLPRPFQLLLLLLRLLGARSLWVRVLQSPGPLFVSAGETLTLNCTVRLWFAAAINGGVKWHKGSDRQQPPIYSQEEDVSSRVIRAVPGSKTDFAISITDIQPEDAGTYYCVKYRAEGIGVTEEASGKGTVVSVIVSPKVFLETNPSSPVELNTNVTVTCNMQGFYPNDANLYLFENNRISKTGKADPVTQNQDGTFSLKSSLEVTATEERNQSEFTCLVRHHSQRPVKRTAMLIIRAETEDNGSSSNLRDQWPLSTLGLWIGLVLSKIVAVLVLLYLLFKKEPMKVNLRNTTANFQEQGPAKSAT
ncbi:tyrosine-protein phosphatase non-receptor type substrate 1-like [Elgaria multicarinata webbii]|uniref:tyrosine-protein phosphatase non-receptor type substrate 1-like n=1 Tax=Elgaria multicarinata webbii TaxID=159646 RepID=UPI002FCD1C84